MVTAKKNDRPEIVVDKIHNGWTFGRVKYHSRTYRYTIKNFIDPSVFGINKGCISKLYISNRYGELAAYDRGWIKKPRSDVAKTVYRAILRRYDRGMPDNLKQIWLETL